MKKKVKSILLPALLLEVIMFLWSLVKIVLSSGDLGLIVKRFFGIFVRI